MGGLTMKKSICYLLLLCIGTMLCACSKNTELLSESITEDTIENVVIDDNKWTIPEDYPKWMDDDTKPADIQIGDTTYDIAEGAVDRILYHDLESLEKASELIVIGEFVDDATQVVETMYEANQGCEVIWNGISTNTFLVSKVIKGDIKEGTEIRISQRYLVDEEHNKFITFSSMTPMKKGDQWIYCLMPYNEYNQSYYTAGDYTGRFPYKDISWEDFLAGKYTADDLGLFQCGMFASIYGTYKELVDKYKIVFD